MNNDNYKKIVDHTMKMTYNEFMEQIRYLFRYSNNGPIHIIHKYCDHHIDEINKKNVEDLTDEEKVILMTHWAYENGGIDRYRETPFSIINSLTDAEVVREFNKRCNNPSSSVTIKATAGFKEREF